MINLVFKLKRKLGQWSIRLSPDQRPSSYPYLSGDGFRKIADQIYDETTKCQPTDIKEGTIVFLKTDYLEEFFTLIHPEIKGRYKLITHNSDRNITEKDLCHIDDKIIHWFAQNATVSHPRLTPIPIGLENLHYYTNGITKIFDYLRRRKFEKKNKILFGFSSSSNPSERQVALKVLRDSPLTEEIKEKINPINYLGKLATYKFVASPSGNGLDCHRTWEALYLGAIPIVRRAPMFDFFTLLGLPFLQIDKWPELATLTSQQLEDDYLRSIERLNPEILFIDYWITKIKE